MMFCERSRGPGVLFQAGFTREGGGPDRSSAQAGGHYEPGGGQDTLAKERQPHKLIILYRDRPKKHSLPLYLNYFLLLKKKY